MREKEKEVLEAAIRGMERAGRIIELLEQRRGICCEPGISCERKCSEREEKGKKQKEVMFG